MIKKKQKTLLPTLKERKRYLAFEVISDAPLGDYQAAREEIAAQTLQFLGELGGAEAGIWFIDERWDVRSQRGLVRVNNLAVDKLKTALALIERINGQRVMMRSLGVSGILNKAADRYIAA